MFDGKSVHTPLQNYTENRSIPARSPLEPVYSFYFIQTIEHPVAETDRALAEGPDSIMGKEEHSADLPDSNVISFIKQIGNLRRVLFSILTEMIPVRLEYRRPINLDFLYVERASRKSFPSLFSWERIFDCPSFNNCLTPAPKPAMPGVFMVPDSYLSGRISGWNTLLTGCRYLPTNNAALFQDECIVPRSLRAKQTFMPGECHQIHRQFGKVNGQNPGGLGSIYQIWYAMTSGNFPISSIGRMVPVTLEAWW